MDSLELKKVFGDLIPKVDPLVLLRAIEQNPASIVITKPDGSILYANTRFSEVTGYSLDEVLGENPRVLKGHDGYTDYKEMWLTLTAGKQWRGEFHNRRKDGSFYWELASISPILNDNGEITHYLAIKEEITDRKQMEAQLHQTVSEATQLSSNLELRNAEIEQQRQELDEAYKTLKAAQSQMLQREKMASIGQLAAGVAHEINNPMGFISSNLRSLNKYLQRLSDYIETLEQSLHDQPQWLEVQAVRKKLKLDFLLEDCNDLIGESLDGADRVKRIVQNLKTFSRVDQAEEQLADLNEVIESTIAMVWNEIKYKSELEKNLQEIPDLLCNPQELGQVFTNILVNAAQAIEKKGRIRVSSRCEQGRIQIEIADNGCGIEPENLGKIFDPFFTTKPVGLGTGLGMSISYEIVKKHGGEIRVTSTPGEGTCFHLSFPLERKAGVAT